MQIAVDTKILLRLLNRSDVKHAEVRVAVRQLRRQHQLCFFPQNAGEFWNACTRPVTSRGGFGLTIPKTAKRLAVLEKHFQVLIDPPGMYNRWKQLIQACSVRGVQVHDARIAASMLEHGISCILTYNTADFARYSGITAIAPPSVTAQVP
ncbi:MAG TPA: PIN domain-containing protein [Gemmatales bacterium]|nr:PIN domain-containing protein [Gemmatales bacterium]